MFTIKHRISIAAFLAAALAVTGTGLQTPFLLAQGRVPQPDGQRGQPPNEVRGVVKAIDVGKGTLTVVASEGRQEPSEKTFTLTKTTEIGLGGGGIGRRTFLREGKLADLASGALVSLRLTADQKTVEFILADGPVLRAQIKSVDAGKNQITVTVSQGRGNVRGQRDEAVVEEKTFTLAKNAEIAMDDGRGKIFSIKEVKLGELPVGAAAALKLAVDATHVQSILVEGATVQGTVKSVDAGKNQITLTTRGAGRGEVAPEEQTYTVGSGAAVLLDDGKGRRFSLKEGQLADVPAGAIVILKLSPDQKEVVALQAEGPSTHGAVKAVDAGKNTITLVTRASRDGTPEEEKTYTVAPDAHVFIDGKEAKLADVKVDEKGPPVGLKMSLDQKVVQSIISGTGSGRR